MKFIFPKKVELLFFVQHFSVAASTIYMAIIFPQNGTGEMDVIKFRDDTMVCGATKRTLICNVIDLNRDLCDKLKL